MFKNWNVSFKKGDKARVVRGEPSLPRQWGHVVSADNQAGNVTIKHHDGVERTHHFSTVTKYVGEEMSKDVKTAEQYIAEARDNMKRLSDFPHLHQYVRGFYGASDTEHERLGKRKIVTNLLHHFEHGEAFLKKHDKTPDISFKSGDMGWNTDHENLLPVLKRFGRP